MAVICCSYYMQEELQRVLQLPGDKIQLIRNGVNRRICVDEALKDELLWFAVGTRTRRKSFLRGTAGARKRGASAFGCRPDFGGLPEV